MKTSQRIRIITCSIANSNRRTAIAPVIFTVLFGHMLAQAQPAGDEVIAFHHAEVSSISHLFCRPTGVTPNPGDGVAVFTLSVPCDNNITIGGRVTVTFPSGSLTGKKTSGGKPVFQLSSPTSAEFGISIDSNASTLPGWTVTTTVGADYAGTPEASACRPGRLDTACSFPYLYYATDFAFTERPYFLASVTIAAPNSDKLQYDVKIFFAPAKEGIDHLEVIQVVQDAQSTVPLIAGKQTLLRAFVRMTNEVPDMTITIQGTLNGQPASGSPIVRKFKSKTFIDRYRTDGSENYELPDEWTAGGRLDIEVELKLPDGVQRTGSFTSKASGTFEFQAGKQDFSVGFVQFCYCLPGGPERRPNAQLSQASGILLEKLFPIDARHVNYRMLSLPMQTWTSELSAYSDGGVLSATQKIFDTAIGKGLDQLVAFMPHVPATKLAGISDPKWDSWFGRGRSTLVFQFIRGASLLDPVTIDYTAGTVAHEIAHNLGRRHTNKFGKKAGWCSDYDEDADYPYSTPLIQEPGWDPFRKNILSPDTNSDLMSYCRNDGIDRWIAPFTYRKLFEDKLLPRVERPSPVTDIAREAVPAPALSGESIVISGMARKDGAPSRLDPVYRVPSDGNEEPSLATGASHCLRFSGAGGAPLGDHCFFLPFLDAEDRQPLDRQFFTLKVPFPVGVTRVALVAGSTELASLTSSSAPPTLEITSPKAGDRWDGGTRTIAWTASSKDGKPLTYAVLYSSDGGQSWLPIVLDIKDTQYTFDTSQIDGGRNVMFRVMASDGLDSTTVNVGPLELAQTVKASLSTQTLDFGNVAVDQAQPQTLTISNTGNGPLNIGSYTFDRPAFKIVAGKAPVMLPAGESVDVTVQWTPGSAGALSGTLKIASNDPASPATVILTGRAEVATACSFTLSSAGGSSPAAGGESAVDVNANMSSCAWTAAANDAWIALAGASRRAGSGRVTFSVLANPTTAARTGTLTIAGRTYTVSQAAGSANLGGGNAVLQADGGTFNQAVGYPAGKSNVYFVVRLTPPSYPATLNAVQIYFGRRADGLAQGAGITVLAGSTTAATLDGVTLARSSGSVGTLDGFNTYVVAPQTITSGDFVVGFAVDNARGILPADQDAASSSRQRSYVSTNGGASFILLDDVPGVGGNLAIRATATVGRSSVQ